MEKRDPAARRWALAVLAALLVALGAAAALGIPPLGELDVRAALALLVLVLVSGAAGLAGLWTGRKSETPAPAWLRGVGCAGHLLLWLGLTSACFAPLAFVFVHWAFVVAPFFALGALGLWRRFRRQLLARASLVEPRTARRSSAKAWLLVAAWLVVLLDVLVRPSGRSLGTGFVEPLQQLSPSLAAAFGVSYRAALASLGLCAHYWGAPPALSPPGTTLVLVGARALVTPLLALTLQARFGSRDDIVGFSIALCYALLVTGSWSFYYELALDRANARVVAAARSAEVEAIR